MNLESAGQPAVSEAELRLLGPVEVVLEGRLIDVGHARQLVVLAALAVEVNQPTPPDRLVDRVWGNRPPQRAREALQSYLSRLRKALRPTGMVIAHRPTGYVLEAEPMAVDLHRFRALVEQAGPVDDIEAYPLLDQAQALWRGPVLETADTPWADQVRHALEGERFAAQLRRTDVGLRLGLHADLVAALVAAGAEHPWDERLASQTMLALYRCGRVADALECYRGFRARLADELGSEPGVTLRDLHQRMLEADPMLDLTAPRIEATSPDAPRVVPRQLLAPATTFAGRAAELAELTSMMAAESPDQPTIVAISAGGGMGKTWLAREWAGRHASGYPDGQLYVDLHGFDPVSEPTTAAAALRWFLNALDVTPADVPAEVDAQAALYRTRLADRRMLVVLDNAPDSSTVAPLLPGGAGCSVLVTSRRRLTGLAVTHGLRTLTLDVMPADQAREVVAGHLGRARVAAEEAAVRELVERCSGLPLALGIAGARAASLPSAAALADYVAELRATATRLDALDAGELTVSLRAVLACSVRALSRDATRVFRLMGRAPGPDLGLTAVSSLAALPARSLRPLLAELEGAHLVLQSGLGRFGMHDLVRLQAAELGRDDPETTASQRRLLDHLLHTSQAASQLLSPHQDAEPVPAPSAGVLVEPLADTEEALAWFEREDQVLVANIQHAGEAGFDDHAVRLPRTLATYYDRRGHWQEWALVQEVAVAAAERMDEPRARAENRRLLGNAYSTQRRYDDAVPMLRGALADYEGLGDADGCAHVHFDLALLHDRAGRPAEALPHAREALTWYRAVPYPLGEAVALNALGWYHAELGEFREAVERCSASLALATEIDSDYARSNALDSLGYAHHQLGEDAEAADCYQQAIVLFGTMGDRHGEAIARDHLGDSLLASGDEAGAHAAWEASAAALTELGHPDADAVRSKLGSPRASH